MCGILLSLEATTMEIGQKIKKIRELRNYSQEYLAERLGISQVSYSRIENGQTRLDLQRMKQIAEVLEVDPVMLLSFDESFVFNNCNQPQGYKDSKVTNHYHTLAETERQTLLNRIQQLEKQLEELTLKKKNEVE